MEDASSIFEYLHGKLPPLIHRDIKPSNVLRCPDGRYRIVDFGSVARALRADGTTVVGTFGYMAPEQFQGRAGPASDIYGLAATILTSVTGVEPERQPHRGLAIDVQHALGPAADAQLCRLLQGMLEADPDVRPSNLRSWLSECRLTVVPTRRTGGLMLASAAQGSNEHENDVFFFAVVILADLFLTLATLVWLGPAGLWLFPFVVFLSIWAASRVQARQGSSRPRLASGAARDAPSLPGHHPKAHPPDREL